MFHRSSHFPIALALLTVALIIFMILSFTDRLPKPKSVLLWNRAPVAVQMGEYDAALQAVFAEHEVQFKQAQGVLKQRAVVDRTIGRLLGQRVPEQRRTYHLEAMVHMNGLREELISGTEPIEDSEWEAFLKRAPWAAEEL